MSRRRACGFGTRSDPGVKDDERHTRKQNGDTQKDIGLWRPFDERLQEYYPSLSGHVESHMWQRVNRAASKNCAKR